MKQLDDWREKLGFESRGYPPMRMVEKPWGHEEIWAETKNYLGKVLVINLDHRLSRQYHNFKEETFRVLSGVLTLEIGEGDHIATIIMQPGDSFHCSPKTIHRMICEKARNQTAVQVLEVSTNPPGIKEDVVRLEDDYIR
jgi:mannose-6-phosphate isomerase